MKRIRLLYIVFLVVGVCFIAGGLVYAFYDRPGLSQNEVVDIVKYKLHRPDASVTATYVGDSKWEGAFSYNDISYIYEHQNAVIFKGDIVGSVPTIYSGTWQYFENTKIVTITKSK